MYKNTLQSWLENNQFNILHSLFIQEYRVNKAFCYIIRFAVKLLIAFTLPEQKKYSNKFLLFQITNNSVKLVKKDPKVMSS